MDFNVDELGDVKAVRISGNLDTQASPVAQEQLIQLIDNGSTKILIDFENLNYISSSGLRMLLVAVKKLKSAGGEMRICNANKMVQEVFEVSGFSDILSVYTSEAEARDGF